MFCSMALQSGYVQHYIAKSNGDSMCYCMPCRSFGLSVLVGILSGVDSDHGTGPRRNSSVNSRSTLYPMLTKDVHLSSHLPD